MRIILLLALLKTLCASYICRLPPIHHFFLFFTIYFTFDIFPTFLMIPLLHSLSMLVSSSKQNQPLILNRQSVCERRDEGDSNQNRTILVRVSSPP